MIVVVLLEYFCSMKFKGINVINFFLKWLKLTNVTCYRSDSAKELALIDLLIEKTLQQFSYIEIQIKFNSW